MSTHPKKTFSPRSRARLYPINCWRKSRGNMVAMSRKPRKEIRKSERAQIRRNRDRNGAGGTTAGSEAGGGGDESRDHRARLVRRNVREYGVHSDQDVGRERVRGPDGAACG